MMVENASPTRNDFLKTWKMPNSGIWMPKYGIFYPNSNLSISNQRNIEEQRLPIIEFDKGNHHNHQVTWIFANSFRKCQDNWSGGNNWHKCRISEYKCRITAFLLKILKNKNIILSRKNCRKCIHIDIMIDSRSTILIAKRPESLRLK